MRAAGLQRRMQVVDAEETETGGYQMARELLQGATVPSAVFAVNDVAAMGMLAAADDVGLRVPADLSVVGYDDNYLANLRGVSLTSIGQPTTRLAEEITTALVGRAVDPTKERRRIRRFLAPSLTVRKTSGVAANR